jgi:hypothetical protein
VAELLARAAGQGVPIAGELGLLQQLTKLVLEASLEGEMDAHPGYAKHISKTPAGKFRANWRDAADRQKAKPSRHARKHRHSWRPSRRA